MIGARMLVLLAAVVCGPAAAQEPRPFPPAAEPTVVLEAKWVTVPAGFCDRHLPADRNPALGDNELQAFLRAVQGDRAAAVLAAPRLTVASGREGTVQVGETRLFVTGLKTHVVNGTGVLVPQNEPCELGPVVHLRPTVLADGKGVKLDVRARRSVVEKVELIPFVTQIQPVAEPGTTRPPVPFTQYLQAPTIGVREVSKKLTVPVGGTAVVRGWQEPVPEREPEAMGGQIPYLNRVLKSVSNKPAMVEVVLLVTAREVVTQNTAWPERYNAVGLATTPEQFRNQPVRVIKAEEEIHGVEPGAKHVGVQVSIMDASPEFADDLGIPADVQGPAWVTTEGRERRMFNALVRSYTLQKKLEVLGRPVMQVENGKTGFARAGAVDGAAVDTEVTPTVAADGKSVTLKVRYKQTARGGMAVDFGNGQKAPGFTSQETTSTVTVPFGATAVLRHVKNRSADGKGTDTLIVLTPHAGELPK